ncbi:MAG TPA: Gfo/Idh/MocA family oxidoreductase [Vicinamibacteria bacterium]|nr:Gfo/Idh/MocA family oxidoreductase [Vicinamibacteria bacterium]
MKPASRRKFLSQTIAAGTAALAAPGVSAASADRVRGANDRIRIGLIGCGGMGRSNLKDFVKVDGVECVALCDVDDAQVAKTRKEVLEAEKAGPAPRMATRDFRRLLDDKDIDAVIVATPDHWHAIPTILACQAGKDVYVEKPLSVSIAEGRAMVEAARKHGRVVQMGTQQRSATHFTDAVEYVRSGKLGNIRLVRNWAYLDWKGVMPVVPDEPVPAGVDYDLWLGPAPARPFNTNRFHFLFRWYWDYSGGLMTDWGAHMIDIANWAMGIKAPSSAVSVGGKFGYPDDAKETPDTQQVIWAYPGFTMTWEHAIGLGRGPESREHGVAFVGENGTLVVDRQGWEVFAETDRIDKRLREYKAMGVPRQAAGREEYHLAHVKDFLACMRSRERPRSDVEKGHDSMIACHLGNMAQRLGRMVKWDVEREAVIGDPEAQAMVSRAYRAPWTLPRA